MDNACDVSKCLLHVHTNEDHTASVEKVPVHPPLKYVLKTKDAFAPEKATPGSAGFDLRSPIQTIVPAGGRKLIWLKLVLELPEGTYGRIAPKSGLAVQEFVDVGAGVIDNDYRGEVGVLLFNFSKYDLVIHRGDCIAQIIPEHYLNTTAVGVHTVSMTERGEGGFGSTKKHNHVN